MLHQNPADDDSDQPESPPVVSSPVSDSSAVVLPSDLSDDNDDPMGDAGGPQPDREHNVVLQARLAMSFPLLQAQVLQHNFALRPQFLCEVFSPPRVTTVASQRGHTADFAFDIEYNQWDALNPTMRVQLSRIIHIMAPRVLVLSPPCTMFSPLMRQGSV